jgi:hypothetical protein
MASTKKTVTATISMQWLLYDIMNETYLRGRTIQNDDNHKEVASMFASEDDENRDKILRSIKKGFAEVMTALAEYVNVSDTTLGAKQHTYEDEDAADTGTTAATSDTSADDTPIDSTTDLTLTLSMPSNFNEAATAGLGEAVHDYLKNITVAEWYMVTNKADVEQYAALAQRSMASILSSVSKRSRPSRPTE